MFASRLVPKDLITTMNASISEEMYCNEKWSCFGDDFLPPNLSLESVKLSELWFFLSKLISCEGHLESC